MLEPGEIVDRRYRIEKRLGSGSMGLVFLGRDIHLDRPVAVKVIAPEYANIPEFAQGFRREAAALAAVRHNHVATVYSFGPHAGGYCFAMEYVRGPNLMDLIDLHDDHRTHIPTFRAASIIQQVARGIEAVHAVGLVHRDVKPANVVIEEATGRPVLVDFGLAVRAAPGAVSKAGGTPVYMAPEQAKFGSPVTPASDQYSLACTAYEALTGRPPFLASTAAEVMRLHAESAPKPLRIFREELEVFDGAFERALAKDPKERFPSVAAFGKAVGHALSRWSEARAALPPDTMLASTLTGSAPAADGLFDILVVDDDDLSRRLATRAAQIATFRARIRVRTAASGDEAIRRAEERRPDLVLLDYDMPGRNGVDTLSVLRALPGGDEIRVIVTSGKAGERERWRFLVLGIEHFVEKPISLGDLVERIQQTAEAAGLRRKLRESESGT